MGSSILLKKDRLHNIEYKHNWLSNERKIEVDFQPTLFIKINSRWIKDFNVKLEKRFLQENLHHSFIKAMEENIKTFNNKKHPKLSLHVIKKLGFKIDQWQIWEQSIFSQCRGQRLVYIEFI